eukprot:567246-Hanusia_phi.AAC.2
MMSYDWMDEEVLQDVTLLRNELAANEVSSSTFDEYCKEVLSGKLDWTPRHKSTAFWEHNTHRLGGREERERRRKSFMKRVGTRVEKICWVNGGRREQEQEQEADGGGGGGG